MKTDLLKIAVIAIILSACIILFQTFLFKSLTLVLFVGITVTFTAGAEYKKAKNYLLSVSFGVAWGVVFLGMEHLFKQFGWNEQLAMFAVFAIFTFAVRSVHNVFIKKTWANIVGFAFAGVIGVIYGGIDQLIPVFISLYCGIIGALLSVWVSDLLIKPAKPLEIHSLPPESSISETHN